MLPVCVCVCGSGCGGGPAALQGAAVLLVGRRAVTNPGRLLIGRQPVLRHQLALPANTHTQRVRHTHLDSQPCKHTTGLTDTNDFCSSVKSNDKETESLSSAETHCSKS